MDNKEATTILHEQSVFRAAREYDEKIIKVRFYVKEAPRRQIAFYFKGNKLDYIFCYWALRDQSNDR